MDDLTTRSATAAAVAFRSGELKPSVFVDALLDKIAGEDEGIGAFLDVHVERARAAALASDKRYAEGESLGPLDGVPVAVKDNILVHGTATTAGSKVLEGYTASFDATVIDRLKKVGAVILGKTNMDEFAMGSSTEHSAYQKTRNPQDTTRVPGGSSGGSAAAVAASFVPLAIGSDTGGSVRQPAAFCGVVGMKPTYGRVSRSGLIAMASSLDQIGPFARTVEDAELLFDTIAGYDSKDATTHHEITERAEDIDMSSLRIGLPKEYFGEGLDPRIRAEVERAVETLKAQGATIEEVSLPNTPHALAVYYIIMPAEASSNLARFDGVRYKNSTLDLEAFAGDFWDVYFTTKRDFFGAEVKRRIMLGTFALSSGYYDAYYTKAQKVRALIKKDFDKAFANVDVLITPTVPTLPFRFGEKTDDPLAMYLEDIYTVSANLAGIPGISLPFGNIEEDGSTFGVGVQILGPAFSEGKLFDVARTLEVV